MTFWTYDIFPNAGYSSGFACYAASTERVKALLQTLVVYPNFMFYPVIILLILTILLAIKILNISKGGKELHLRKVYRKGSENEGRKREVRAATTITALAIVSCTLYIPSSMLVLPFSFSPVFSIFNTQQLTFLIMAARIINFTILVRLWNIYLYIFRIPKFKEELIKLLKCQL